GVAPLVEVGRVPENHLGVVLAVPADARQPRLRGRELAGVVDPHEVERKHHPSLQLRCTWVGAAGEIDQTALAPERLPAFRAGALEFVDGWPVRVAGVAAEPAREGEGVAALGVHAELVWRERGEDTRALPAPAHVTPPAVHPALDLQQSRPS